MQSLAVKGGGGTLIKTNKYRVTLTAAGKNVASQLQKKDAKRGRTRSPWGRSCCRQESGGPLCEQAESAKSRKGKRLSLRKGRN